MFFSVDKKTDHKKEYQCLFNRRNSSLVFGSGYPTYFRAVG